MKKLLTLAFLPCMFLALYACSKPEQDLNLPAGFHLDVFAENATHARQMALGHKGTLFVGSKKAGTVFAFIDKDGDYKADQRLVIRNDLNIPTGVAFRDGDLYVAGPDKILRYKDIEENLGSPGKPSVVLDGLPKDRYHGMRALAFGPDGMLYTHIGVPCNICLLDSRAIGSIGSIIQIDPNTGDFSIYASGIRNSVGLAWQKDSRNLWFTDNGRDWLGDDIPPDEINLAPQSGLHFGFPFVYGDNVPEDDFYDKRPEAITFTKPAFPLQAHSAPLGLAFYHGKQFPEAYRNSLFVAQHGSWNRSTKVGYRILNFRVKNNALINKTVFAEGWLKGSSVTGRPVDIIELGDGSLLISDDKTSKIYRISYQ